MKLSRRLTGLTIAVALLLAVIAILAFADANAATHERCFASFATAKWPQWIGCAMAAHENLAGGLIGFAGAVFAAWLAYSGAQDQLHRVMDDAREAARLRAVERLDQATVELDALRTARGYLANFAEHFPQTTDEGYETFRFAAQLRQLNNKALVFLSQSAANAPEGYGRRIATAMWRMQTLAERIEEHISKGASDFTIQSNEIKSILEGIRSMIADLDNRLPILQKRLENLAEQVNAVAG